MFIKEIPSTLTDLRTKSFELAQEVTSSSDLDVILKEAELIFNFISKDFLPK